MNQYIVNGNRPLFGEVTISGAKNAAVAIIPAALMVDGICRIENIPQISDVTLLFSILDELGAKVRVLNQHAVEIDSRHIHSTKPSFDLVRKIRASYYLIGALLGRFGQATVAMPGGCNFGVRPIDQHVKGFKALGAEVTEGNFVEAVAKSENGRLVGAPVYMDVVSVGATMNVMMAAVLAEGITTIENAAKEPHIVDLANFLNSMGADIKGAGTDSIKIRGVERLNGGTYCIIPDQIEAGTYMTAVAATGGQLLIKNIIPKHMECISAKLMEMGVYVEEIDDTLLVRRSGPLQRAKVKTQPYPGFPTDMQPQIATVMALAEGTSMVTEAVWNNRFRYVDELRRLGANIQVDGRVAVIEGIDHFTGAPIEACDLRAGAAMVVAALAAHGTTEISHVQYIERGYEDLVGKLRAVGADIRIVEVPDEDLGMENIG
ncbi:MAG: UDP-N-acetylglucosamine 1-carboxyvinyltransferase [Ruminococcaceae bacterium]|nr:UDP-N-acetylglucosamine 1-carboxyvinyltransferase [Oscillospiraceae bacterium]